MEKCSFGKYFRQKNVRFGGEISFLPGENGGEVVETEFFPLDVTQFGATISKIQAAAPDMVMSVLVGTGHLGFYRQWAASGMKSKIPMEIKLNI